jgi:hypothetical protein
MVRDRSSGALKVAMVTLGIIDCGSWNHAAAANAMPDRNTIVRIVREQGFDEHLATSAENAGDFMFRFFQLDAATRSQILEMIRGGSGEKTIARLLTDSGAGESSLGMGADAFASKLIQMSEWVAAHNYGRYRLSREIVSFEEVMTSSMAIESTIVTSNPPPPSAVDPVPVQPPPATSPISRGSPLVLFPQREFEYRPSMTDDELSKASSAVSDLIVSKSLVHVDGYSRGGAEVGPYVRRPPGGITNSDKLKGDTAGLIAGIGLVALDYAWQWFNYPKVVEQPPITQATMTSARPMFPLVTRVDSNSIASDVGIQVGDFILVYGDDILAGATSKNNPLGSMVDKARGQGGGTVDLTLQREGKLLHAKVPAGRELGVSVSQGIPPYR